jgi:MarR family transcriptional regulator, transcriptional regulator for hemolysin
MSLEKPLGYIFGQTKQVYRNKLTAKFKENDVDLSLGLYIIMFQIDLNEAVTQQYLADHLQKDKSIVMRQINALIEKGYVIRSWNKKDKRKKNLVLTPEGQKVLELTRNLARSVSKELLSGVNDEDQRVFEHVIQRILENGGSDDNTILNDKIKK